MTDHMSQQFGNYRLVRHLGRGAFSDVYLGIHVHLKTPAAIKLLHTELTSSDVPKFRDEARTIARLEHPHIVRVLNFGIEDHTPFFVMVYAPNGTLRQRHPKGLILITCNYCFLCGANSRRIAVCTQPKVYSSRYQAREYVAGTSQ